MVSVARVALISKRRKSRLRGTEIMVGWLVMRRLGWEAATAADPGCGLFARLGWL